MSGTASVPTQFQAAVTATGLQLDNNFSTIVAYLNDPTNRTNYGTDGGTTNTLVINPSPPVATGYSAGLTITFRAAFSSSGAVVANVSGLGNASVLDQQGRQLTVSAIIQGSVYQMAHNGTSAFNLLSSNAIVASQPAFTSITSGAGTYTVSSGSVRIRIRGGGGGGGGGVDTAVGGGGGDTRFGILLAGGGGGGPARASIAGGFGGTATGATVNIVGGRGMIGLTDAVAAFTFGGAGGNGWLGGAGSFGTTGGVGVTAGSPNTGAGGGGSVAAGGGGAGAYFEHNFLSPSASYTYSVGVGGTAAAGAATGAAGIILIETFFA